MMTEGLDGLLAWRGTEIPSVLLLLLAAATWGRLLLRKTMGNYAVRENTAAAVALGLDLIMAVWLLADWGRQLRPAVCLVLISGFYLGGVELWRGGWKRPGRYPWTYWFLLGVLLLLSAPAWCPPVGWDELTYHLAVPLRWLHDGAPRVYSDLPYSAFPAGPEILFQGLLALGGVHAPRVFCWLLNAVFFIGIYRWTARRAGSGNGLLLTLVLLIMPVFLMLQRETFVEIFILLNVLALVTLTVRRHDRTLFARKSGWLPLGLAAAGCAAVKLYGLAAGGAALLPLLARSGRRRYWQGPVLAAVVGVLLLLPFYGRPWAATGDPFYPYYAGWWGGDAADRAVSAWHHAAAALRYGPASWTGVFSTPFLLAAGGREFDGALGWQWLALLVGAGLVMYGAVRRRQIRLLLWGGSALLYYLCWYGLMPQVRFLLPVLVLLLPVWVVGLEHVRLRRWAAVLLLVLAAVSVPAAAIKHYANCWRYLFDAKVSRADFVYSATGPGYLPAVEMAYRLVPPGRKLVLIFDHRTAYFPAGTELGTPFVQRRYFTPLPADATALASECRAKQVEYLLVLLTPHHPDRVPQYFQPALAIPRWLEELRAQGQAQLLWAGDGGSLYRLTP